MNDALHIDLPATPISREQIRTQIARTMTAQAPHMRTETINQITALGLPVDHDRIERALLHAEFLAWAGFVATLAEHELLLADEAEPLLTEARFILEAFMEQLADEDED